MNETKQPAVAGPVEPTVRPRAWLVEDPNPNGPRTFIATQDMEDAYSLATDEAPPIPLYDQAAIDAESRRWRSSLHSAARAVVKDFQASGDADLDALVRQAVRDLCRHVGVDFEA